MAKSFLLNLFRFKKEASKAGRELFDNRLINKADQGL